jgi:hypothetical protein
MGGNYSEQAPSSGVASSPANGSHWGFIFWLVVFTAAAIAALGGLQVGGFSFVFRHR